MRHGGGPTEDVLRAFGAAAAPTPLVGGQGTSWRAGNLVLKPAAEESVPMLRWLHDVVRPRVRPAGVRLGLPVAARDGALRVHGWQAAEWLPGAPVVGRWHERADVARRVACAVQDVDPATLPERHDAWARADRAAWGEASPAPLGDHPLARALGPLSAPIALVHGDITGNTVFEPGLPPAVIDLSLYARPVEWSVAVLAVDALAFEGAPLDLLATISDDASFPQYLARALLFRMTTDVLLEGRVRPEYAPVASAVLATLG